MYTDKEGLHTKEDITKAASKQEGQKTVDREIFSALLILWRLYVSQESTILRYFALIAPLSFILITSENGI
jgi:hypothetical protein